MDVEHILHTPKFEVRRRINEEFECSGECHQDAVLHAASVVARQFELRHLRGTLMDYAMEYARKRGPVVA